MEFSGRLPSFRAYPQIERPFLMAMLLTSWLEKSIQRSHAPIATPRLSRLTSSICQSIMNQVELR